MTSAPDSATPVTVLTTSFPRFSGDIAGHFVRSACEAVSAHGFALTVVTPHAPGAARTEAAPGLRIRRFRYAFPSSAQRLQWSTLKTDWIARASVPGYVGAFAAAARRHGRGAALIHGHWAPSALIAHASMVGRTRVPLLVSLWGSDAALVGRGRIGRRLLSALRRADALTVVSSRMKGDLVAAGAEEERVHVVRSAVKRPSLPPIPASQAREALDLPTDRPVFLFLGRLATEKGPDVLMEALERLAPSRRPYVVLAGDGPLAVALRTRMIRSGLSGDVRFAGFVPHDEIGPWLRAADALVLPSRSEGLPHAALEAMAVGLPVIASSVGGLPEVVRHGVNGWLVGPEDGEELAEVLADAASDPVRLVRFGATAREDVLNEYVGYERMGRQLAALYESVLGRPVVR